MTDSKCGRTGCRRKRFDVSKPGCSAVCSLVVKLTREAENLENQLGRTDATAAFSAAAHDLNTALESSFRSRSAIRRAAVDAGFSEHQWAQLLYGNYNANSEIEMVATIELDSDNSVIQGLENHSKHLNSGG